MTVFTERHKFKEAHTSEVLRIFSCLISDDGLRKRMDDLSYSLDRLLIRSNSKDHRSLRKSHLLMKTSVRTSYISLKQKDLPGSMLRSD